MLNLQLTFILFITIILTIWSPIHTLPQGAPESVCGTMLPFHGGGSILPSQQRPPFRIDTSSSVIGQGQTLLVEIVTNPPQLIFEGFMIQARNRNPPYEVVGQFSEASDGFIKLMNCDGVKTSATHSDTTPKQQLSLEWHAPADFLGQVIFNTTVALQYDRFWVGVASNPVQIVKREAVPPTSVIGISSTRAPWTTTTPVFVPPTQRQASTADPFYDDCGKIKTCLGLPDGCIKDRSCRSMTSVHVRGDIYEFEVKSGQSNEKPAYVAVGISEDDKMGDDFVMECIPENNKVQLYSSWTTGNPNYGLSRDGVPQDQARLTRGSYVNGTIYCKIEKTAVSYIRGRKLDLINNKYHILVASGTKLKPSSAGYHDIGRLASAQPISLAIVQNLSGASTLLLRLHGSFMIAAWIGTTSLGIVLARYFKQTWVGSQTCGKDQWFAWHRMCMVTTWSLTMAAFVIIFVEIGGWSAEKNPHAILGVITTVLCFFQPIGALFRPAPNAKNRPIFNWAHWLGGNLAHILAVVTIFFAVKLAKAELPEWMDWILVAYVAFHVIMHLIFSIAGCASDRHASKRVNTIQLADMTGGRNGIKIERKMDAPFASFRKGLLGLYIVVLILFTIALIVIVALAPIEESIMTIKTNVMGSS